MHMDLVKTSELFLVPSSFLVAALGTADTNYHKAAVSVLGFVVSLLWSWCSWEARLELAGDPGYNPQSARVRILAWFPTVFILGWLVSVVAHVWLAL